MAKIVNCWNEWDNLERVIVGRADGTCMPKKDISWDFTCPSSPGYYGPMPKDMEDKANEELDGLVKILEKQGAVVDRACPINFNSPSSTPDWKVECMHGCMPPRDVLITVGNEILECPMSIRARWYEYLCYRPLLREYFKADPEFLWSAAPKGRLAEDSYESGYYENFANVWTEDEKMARAMQKRWHLTEVEPLFDAADGMRFGKDIFWMHSAVTNNSGMDWIKRHFAARGIRVHGLLFGGESRHWHIDVLLTPLRPGLCMVNPEWEVVNPEFYQLMKRNDWELIPAKRPIHHYRIVKSVVGERDSTSWISMNTLSLDQKKICVEAHETPFQEQLDKLGMEVVAVPFTNVFGFGGELHCSTVDVFRTGNCEDYFPNQVAGF